MDHKRSELALRLTVDRHIRRRTKCRIARYRVSSAGFPNMFATAYLVAPRWSRAAVLAAYARRSARAVYLPICMNTCDWVAVNFAAHF